MAKPHLIQEVIGDTVVPNIATERQAALTGAAAHTGTGDNTTPQPTGPSAFITTNPTESKLVKYMSDASYFYVHSSLLRPYSGTLPGGVAATAPALATVRLQIDLVTYLKLNDTP